MSILRFSDGINIDTSGPIRKMSLKDGWYVVGMGMLVPVINEKEAEIIARDLTKNHTRTSDWKNK